MTIARLKVYLIPVIAAAIFAMLFAPAGSALAQSNLLANANFEEGSYVNNNDGDQRVPNGWSAWWVSPPKNNCYNFKPHYELEQHPSHVKEGSFSARYFTAYSSHNGGLMQTVNVTPGNRYRFSIYGFAWSTNEPVVDTPSETYTKLWVGIDPTGGTDGTATTIVWSPENAQMDHFALFTVEVVAQTSKLTVFTRSRPDWCVARNDSFWDAASLAVVGAAQPPPPAPTQPPSNPPANPPGGVSATTTITLNIRNGPSIYNQIIGYVPAGATVPVLGRDSGSQWIYIDRNGTKGWVAGWLCTINGDLNTVPVVGAGGSPPASTPPPPPSGGVTATPSLPINMRGGPGITFPVIGTIPAGVTVPVVGRDAASSWLLVSYGGKQGWIAGWLCTVQGDLNSVPIGGSAPPTPPPSPPSGGVTATAKITLNIRSGPSTNHEVIGYLPGGETASVVGRADDSQWIQIVRSGLKGWVAGWLCTISGDLNSLPVTGHTGTGSISQPPVAQTAGVTATPRSTINIRSGPNLTAGVISSLPYGSTVPVIGRADDSQWIQIQYGSVTGWVAGWLCTINGDINSVPVTGHTGGSGGGGSPSFLFGGQVHGSVDRADVMRAARMGWAKVQVMWLPSMSYYDVYGLINDIHAAGFKVLLGITGGTYPASIDFDSYVEFVRGVASIGADGIEVWNEMNLDREWPTGQISPASYVNNMLRPSYNAIKSANPNTLVISGAPAPTGAHNVANVWADDVYLAGMRDAGAASVADCIGVHYNAGATSPDDTVGHPADSGNHHYSWYFLPTLRLYAGVFPTRQLCFTELGYLSPEGYGGAPPNFWWSANTTVAQQAAWLARAVTLARSSGRVTMVIVYNVDFNGWGDDPQAGYALIRANGACPACGPLAAAAP